MKKKILMISFLVLILVSVTVSAGFIDVLRSFFFKNTPTGYIAANLQACDVDLDCQRGYVCDLNQPLQNKRGTCVTVPQGAADECQIKVDRLDGRLDLIRLRLLGVRDHV